MKNGSRSVVRTILMAFSLSGALVLAGCGGGGGGTAASTPPAPTALISGVAATGAPITPAMNGVVTIQDSASPANSTSTPTDANGSYAFTAAQLSGWTAPYMLEIKYAVGGVNYTLHSAATASDLTSGSATINITPLTDLVIANLAGDVAENVFKNKAYSTILTPAALSAGAAALRAQLAPVLSTMGVSATVDLLHDSFKADGTNLDAVLDALKVTQDPTTRTATITNRLDGSSITDDMTKTNTEVMSTPSSTVPVTDLQAITAYFNSFSAEMAKAPSATDPALLAFFDQTGFKQDGKNLGAFLQEITSNPTVTGGALTLSDVTLGTTPSWAAAAVPSTAQASYQASFEVTMNKAKNSREKFIVYKDSTGKWVALGNQMLAQARMEVLETNGFNSSGTGTRVTCSGLWPQVNDRGGLGISFAVVNGPGLPSTGLLLFSDANSGTASGDLTIAAGAPSTYAGTATAAMGTQACGFSSLYPLQDADIANAMSGSTMGGSAMSASAWTYTIDLYKDGTPGTPSLANGTKIATYTTTLAAPPLTSTQLSAAMFVSGETATPAPLSLANSNTSAVGSSTISWTAPTASGLDASNVGIWVNNNTPGGNAWTDKDIAGDATSVTLAVPQVAGATNAGVTIDYIDDAFRHYWTAF